MHLDTFDHLRDGLYPWPIVLSGPRPVAWVAMKLISPFGIYAETDFLIGATLLAIFLLALAARELMGLPWPAFLASLPIYAFGLFSSPQFYIKHRDDFELGVSFLLLSIALYAIVRCRSLTNVPLLLIAVVSIALFPLSKETFWVASPLLLGMIAAVFPSSRYFLLTLLCIVAVAVAFVTLHARSPFLNDTTSVYHISIAPSSFLPLLGSYLALSLTLPSLCLCAMGFWNQRANGSAPIILLAFVLAGVASYIPNSLLPNHFRNWYAWDGLPLLLVPLLATVTLGRRAGSAAR